MKHSTTISVIFKILATAALGFYILFLSDEGVPLINSQGFLDLSVYLLFIVFLIGYIFLWKEELVAGLILISWYGLQWLLVFCVWEDGELTLIMGLPIAILGLMLLTFSIIRNKRGA